MKRTPGSTGILGGVLKLVCLCIFLGQSATFAAPLVWENHPGYRSAQVHISAGKNAGFTLLDPAAAGIRFTNHLSVELVMEHQNLMNGAGLAAGDFDGDGLCDLYFCNKEGPNALYRNLGNFQFEDVTARAGVACTNQSSTGAVFADIDGDGKLDLLVTSFTGPNACFLNRGDGTFTEITAEAGLLSKGGTTSMALADVDGDGDLDLYVNYFGTIALLRDGISYATRMVNGKPVVTGRYASRLKIIDGRMVEFGEPDILYLNDGKGHFAPAPWPEFFKDEDGKPMTAPPDFGLAVQMRDINGDGFPDIYVCNDFQTPDRVWLNDGKGHFRAIAKLALRNMSYASMGVDFADFNRDGFLDFLTVEMLSRGYRRHIRQLDPKGIVPRAIGAIDTREDVARNGLYLNRGDGTYAEIANAANIAASDWSWTPIFIDVDLDGYEDVLISNGHMFDVNDLDMTESKGPQSDPRVVARKRLALHPPLKPPKAAFRNRRDLTFEDVTDAWGFNSTEICHGMIAVDLDNDGDLDVVLNSLNHSPLIYRNDSTNSRVSIRLKGNAPNTQGIGARIKVTGGPVTQTQEIIAGGRYLSGEEPMRVFAAGGQSNRLAIEVAWRNGKMSRVEDAEPNRIYEISEEGARESTTGSPPSSKQPLFEDASNALGHIHHEEVVDDFSLQSGLPRRFSQMGPGIAWFDLNSDDRPDLIIGGGKGSSPAVYLNLGGGSFRPLPGAPSSLPDDSSSILGLTMARAEKRLFFGLFHTDMTAPDASALVLVVKGTNLAPGISLPPRLGATGPLALADINGDGDLDLFAGTTWVPGQYPVSGPSRLYTNHDGTFSEYSAGGALTNTGLVRGAIFSDIVGDSRPELILACEWGPIRVFEFPGGVPREITRDLGLDGFTGWWTSVATGDFDGDGRIDIVAGNWGINTFYSRAGNGPWYLYYGDFGPDGRRGIVEAYHDSTLNSKVPWRNLVSLAQEVAGLREVFPSHKAFAEATLSDLLKGHEAQAHSVEAKTLHSTLFLNRGDHFEARVLPTEAQWTPVFGLCAADLDGDGKLDLFLAQNFFATRPEDDRLDAGRGLWLKGRGDGNFDPVSGDDSGIKIYGEQRGAALADFDGDGRIDLAVTQNGAATKLFRNRGARPGLIVHLRGPANNPDAIGAQLRLGFAKGDGVMSEVQAGSGYWSQNSSAQVLALPEKPLRIAVRWPNGTRIEKELPGGCAEIELDISGNLRVLR